MTAPTPRYELLLERIAELRAAAKNKDCEWCREMGWGSCTQHCAPRAALHAPAHEYAAVAEALVRAVDEFPDECSSPYPADPDCWLANARERLDALAKVLL